MPLKVRCENALTGYVLLDIWRLVADRICTSRKLGRGSLWMAPQTHKNLQCCALGIVAVALNFDFPGDCWKSGHWRMTELPIEEWFGRLRSRSSTSQLSARAFWRSAAKEMLRYVKEGKVQPSSRSGGSSPKAVSPEEFFDMSKRALDSAIKLVAFCSNVSEESLRSLGV